MNIHRHTHLHKHKHSLQAANMPKDIFLAFFDNFMDYWSSSDVKKERLIELVRVIRSSNGGSTTLNDIDYLQLFHLGRCLRPIFTWEDCNKLKLMLGRSDDNGKCRERILLGIMSDLLSGESDDVVVSRVDDFLCVVKELENNSNRKQQKEQKEQKEQHQPRREMERQPSPETKPPKVRMTLAEMAHYINKILT